ncbi:hypothetical protein TNCV_1749451, partial [Trichonephila clavipes]
SSCSSRANFSLEITAQEKERKMDKPGEQFSNR